VPRPLPALRIPLLATLLTLAGFASLAAAASPPAYLTQWGTFGTGNGQFAQPAGVALDGSGNVYVADTGNNRIQKFTASGIYLSQWGTAGSGNGQFSGPFGITVAGGSVYVVDSGNRRVQVFTTAGAYVTQWGSLGSGNGQFQQPLCVAAIASHKTGLSLYLTSVYSSDELREWFQGAWKKSGKKLDMGKSCIRIKSLDDVPLAVVGQAIAKVPVDKFIALHEAGRAGAKAKPKSK